MSPLMSPLMPPSSRNPGKQCVLGTWENDPQETPQATPWAPLRADPCGTAGQLQAYHAHPEKTHHKPSNFFLAQNPVSECKHTWCNIEASQLARVSSDTSNYPRAMEGLTATTEPAIDPSTKVKNKSLYSNSDCETAILLSTTELPTSYWTMCWPTTTRPTTLPTRSGTGTSWVSSTLLTAHNILHPRQPMNDINCLIGNSLSQAFRRHMVWGSLRWSQVVSDELLNDTGEDGCDCRCGGMVVSAPQMAQNTQSWALLPCENSQAHGVFSLGWTLVLRCSDIVGQVWWSSFFFFRWSMSSHILLSVISAHSLSRMRCHLEPTHSDALDGSDACDGDVFFHSFPAQLDRLREETLAASLYNYISTKRTQGSFASRNEGHGKTHAYTHTIKGDAGACRIGSWTRKKLTNCTGSAVVFCCERPLPRGCRGEGWTGPARSWLWP